MLRLGGQGIIMPRSWRSASDSCGGWRLIPSSADSEDGTSSGHVVVREGGNDDENTSTGKAFW